MSLFERIKNKRYELQEAKKDGSGGSSRTRTSSNPLETIYGEKPKKEKKYNRSRKGSFEDLTGEGKVKYPKTRKELELKRNEYGINKDGVPSKEGIKRYAEKTKQLQSGSNQPIKITQKDLNVAKERMVGGKPVKNKAGQVIGKTTGKYGGTLNPLSTKAELDAIKRELKTSKTLNAKPLPKVYDPKASKELGTDVFRRIRKKISSSKTRSGKVIDTPTRRVKLLKPNLLKKISTPEIEKIIPKSNPRITTTSFIGPSVPPRTTTTAATKLSKSLMKRKNIYAAGLGLALAGGLYLRNRGKNKEAEKKKLALLNVQKQKDKIQPVDVSLFLNKTGTSPNKLVDKSKQFTPSPYAFRPKNQPKPTYAKPTQYGSFDPKTNKMVQTTKKPKNINKNLP